MSKGRTTQHIANTFGRWTNVRRDEQSLGYQFLNALGQKFDDLRIQEERIAANYFLPTSVVSDIDVYYSYQLPGTYEFTKEDYDNTDFTYTPPSVSGLIDGVYYSVTVASENNIESFWYTSVPDRISMEAVTSGQHLLVSGPLSQSPLPVETQSGMAHIPNHLTVKLTNSASCVGIEDRGLIRRGLVHIQGETREGVELTEELIFLHDETQKTMHDFKLITDSGVRVYGIEPDTATLEVTSANFTAADYPINYGDLDFTVDGDPASLFWGIASGVNNTIWTLDLLKYDIDDIEIRMEGFTDKHSIMKQELLDTGGSNIVPVDIAPEPHSNRVWAVDSDTLYLYTADLPRPNLSALSGKDYHADSVVEPDTYWTTIGDTVEINYIWLRPVKGFVKHRAWMVKPDGTKKSLEGGSEVTYHTDSTSWIFGEPFRRKIRDSEFYVLDQRGDYVFCLEAYYTDDTTSVDKRVVSVLYQEAIAEFSLSGAGVPNSVTGIDFDSEYKMWVLDSAGGKYEIQPHYDVMIIDFDKKVLYFREPYSLVRVLDS